MDYPLVTFWQSGSFPIAIVVIALIINLILINHEQDKKKGN